jgi:hypothetical protein
MIDLTNRVYTAPESPSGRQAQIALSFALLTQIVMLYYTGVFVSFHL